MTLTKETLHQEKESFDPVAKPKHYNVHPSGVECIEITQHMNFCLGNAMKYLWRADNKNGLEDLKKALWYLEREVARREKQLTNPFLDENEEPYLVREAA